MKKTIDKAQYMRPTFLLALALCAMPMSAVEPLGVYQHGTVVRMRMGDCLFAHRGTMFALSGSVAAQMSEETCPE